jgi:hypothetical protein
MAVIERYITAQGVQPRTCQRADLTPGSHRPKCTAELILRGTSGEEFLCRAHAVQSLAAKKELLAEAVIDLALGVDSRIGPT